MKNFLFATALTSFAVVAPVSAAVINLEFDTDSDFSTIEGTGTITVDDSLFGSGAFSVNTDDPLVSFDLNLGGLNYTVGWDNTVPSDTVLIFDSAGDFVGTDDATGMFADVYDPSTQIGDVVSIFAFSDNEFGQFVLYDADIAAPAIVQNTGSGSWRITPVPLPAAGWMLLAGLCSLGIMRRKQA